MQYDFTTVTRRFGMGSNKWDEMLRYHSEDQIPQDVVPFSVADMEFKTAPQISQGLKDFLDTSILGYANATETYKQVVCRWMYQQHGWKAKPEWILPSHGVIDAFFNAAKLYSEEDDGILLLTPVYYPMYYAAIVHNRKVVDCPLVENRDRYEIDFEDFERKAADPGTKVFILCSPHNPVGRVWTEEELRKLGQICNRHGVLVVSDEIHSDLVMPGHKHIVYASLGEEFQQNCLILTAPSKTFNLAGMQTSNVFIPNEQLRQIFFQELQKTYANPKCNILGYKACELAYTKGREWMESCIRVIHTNEELVRSFLAAHFPQIKVFPLEGTYLLWMDWRGLGVDYKELERINREEAFLFFDEGHIFGAQGQGYERWNLACPTACVQAALERMKAVYSKYGKDEG